MIILDSLFSDCFQIFLSVSVGVWTKCGNSLIWAVVLLNWSLYNIDNCSISLKNKCSYPQKLPAKCKLVLFDGCVHNKTASIYQAWPFIFNYNFLVCCIVYFPYLWAILFYFEYAIKGHRWCVFIWLDFFNSYFKVI